MIRKKINRIIAAAFATIFIVGSFKGITVKAIGPSNSNNKQEVVAPQINPTPQSLKIIGDGFELTKSVNIVGEENADKDAIKVLKEFLKENDITVNTKASNDSTTLLIGEVDDNIAELDKAKESLGVEGADLLKENGYILATNNDKKSAGEIIIEGKDEAGTFYGVQTLKQLVQKNDNKVVTPEVNIKDYPTMSRRGIVEGFYGTPWTHQDRLDQIKFYGENKMNIYIYAPKDDQYHREKWREPYPESEMNRMKELIETSKANKVEFVFAVSPGIDIRFDGKEGEEDFEALKAKLESLYNMGVKSFAIYYDDIANKDAVKQATVLNRINEEFVKVKGDVKPLLTVPTEYDSGVMFSNNEPNKYTKDFAATLDKDIEVMYTGPGVVPDSLPLSDLEKVTNVYGKDIAIWWNYPVTDYLKNKLALGPAYGLDLDLYKHSDYFTMNPMEHPELSKISLMTGANYSWNTANYDSNKSWNMAIEKLYGDLADAMKVFANHSTRMDNSWAHNGRKDAPDVREIMNNMWAKLAAREDATEEINALYSEFDKMKSAYDKLTAELPDEILSECRQQLVLFGKLANYDKTALDMVVASINKDTETYDKLKAETQENKAVVDSTWAKISDKVATSFLNEALSFDPSMIDTSTIKVTASSEEIDKENTPASAASDNNLDTFWHTRWSGDNPAKRDHYLQLELDDIYTVNRLRYVPRQDGILNGAITGYRILTSIDGVNFTQVKEGTLEENTDAKFIDIDPVEAKFIKMEVVSSGDTIASAAEFNAYGEKVITENPGDGNQDGDTNDQNQGEDNNDQGQDGDTTGDNGKPSKPSDNNSVKTGDVAAVGTGIIALLGSGIAALRFRKKKNK